MFPLETETPLTQDQVVAMTRLMLHVAHVDGASTTEEVALIRAFYEGCAESGKDWENFATLAANTATPTISPCDFADAGQREMAAATCLMVAWADGAYSSQEATAVQNVANKLGIDSERFAQVTALVKDHMLAQFARLPDTASVVAVAKELV